MLYLFETNHCYQFVKPDTMTKLTNRIINVNNRRTSMRLCQKEWNALEEICKREKVSRNLLIEQIENNKNQSLGLTYATRLFLMLYYKSLAKNSLAPSLDLEPQRHFSEVIGELK